MDDEESLKTVKDGLDWLVRMGYIEEAEFNENGKPLYGITQKGIEYANMIIESL